MNNNNVGLLENNEVIDRVFEHIDNGTTDLGTAQWHEPVEHYTSQSRYEQEIVLLRQRPVVFCPSAAVPDAGSFISRTAAGTPLLVVRDNDLKVRAFINACRHRGMKVASGQGCVHEPSPAPITGGPTISTALFGVFPEKQPFPIWTKKQLD